MRALDGVQVDPHVLIITDVSKRVAKVLKCLSDFIGVDARVEHKLQYHGFGVDKVGAGLLGVPSWLVSFHVCGITCSACLQDPRWIA